MSKNWHENVFFGLHFDLHAVESDIAIGRDLSVEHLIEQLGKVAPDFVQCDCKGHPGLSCYPTQIGVAAPHIIKDCVKIWREATIELDIYLAVHYSAIWDEAVLKKNPHWGRVNLPINSGIDCVHQTKDNENRDVSRICPSSSYTNEYMSEQLLEIIDLYDVDGFWIDGDNWADALCYCNICKDKFTLQTGLKKYPLKKDDEHWDLWTEFSRQNFEEHVRKYTEAVHHKKPECTVCSNWMYTIRQPDEISVPVDYLSGDFDYIWSVERANAEARFMDGRNINWDLMAWGNTSNGQMKGWTFKSISAMCQEAAIVISCGGAFMIYDQPHRTGNLVEWHIDKFAEVARFCRERQEFCQHTQSVPQVVILHSKDHFYSNNSPLYDLKGAEKQMEGAMHALLDNQYHLDILTESDLKDRLENYKLCVIAEQDNLSMKMVMVLKEYVFNGGKLIISGAEHTRLFDDVMGAEDLNLLTGEDNGQRLFIPDNTDTVSIMGIWRFVKIKEALEVEPILLERDVGIWEQNSGSPAAAIKKYGKGKIAAIYGPVFGTYYDSRYPGIRRFVKKVVNMLSIKDLVIVEAPVCINFTFRKKGNRLMMNFVNVSSDNALSPRYTYIENVPETGPIKIKLPLKFKPKVVFIAPGEKSVKWEYGEDGIFQAEIKRIGIHDILVIE